MVSYAVSIIPHFFLYLPLWIIVPAVISFFWRVEIYRQRAKFPSRLFKTFYVLGMVGLFYLLYGKFFNSVGFSALFMMLFSFKFIEAKSIRDGEVLIFLAYFSIGINFIFNNTILTALYALIPFTVTTMALIGLQQSTHRPFSNRFLFNEARKTILFALPFMVLLFLFFPRFPSLLSLNREGTEMLSKTGVSDRMSPGDISELIDEDKLIFWADFKGKMPPRSELYWRVLTLDYFDGVEWSRSPWLEHDRRRPNAKLNYQNIYHYTVMMEPTQDKFLAVLDLSMSDLPQQYEMYGDFHLENKIPMTSKIRYDLTAYSGSLLSPNLDPRSSEVRVHTLFDRRSNQEAQRWVDQHLSGLIPDAQVEYLRQYIHNNEFYYTLKPNRITGDFVDNFFFDSGRGFCEHYASSAAFLLRAAGTPARVVVGYLGGIIEPEENRIQVRSSHAHAWVEYWVQGEGWKRFDPTAAIHPSRVEDDLDTLQDGERRFEGTLLQWAKAKGVALGERIEYYWAKFILGYNAKTHLKFLEEWFGTLNLKKLLTILLTALLPLLLLVALLFIKPWRNWNRGVEGRYRDLIALINPLLKEPLAEGISPRALLSEVTPHLKEESLQTLHYFLEQLEYYLYQPDSKIPPKSVETAYRVAARALKRERREEELRG